MVFDLALFHKTLKHLKSYEKKLFCGALLPSGLSNKLHTLRKFHKEFSVTPFSKKQFTHLRIANLFLQFMNPAGVHNIS